MQIAMKKKCVLGVRLIHRDDLAVGFLAPPHPVDSGEIVGWEMLVILQDR